MDGKKTTGHVHRPAPTPAHTGETLLERVKRALKGFAQPRRSAGEPPPGGKKKQ